MFGLRLKLLLAFGGLLAILLSVSAVGIVVLTQYRTDLNRFLSENWNSVEYGQTMVYSLITLDDTARQIEGVGPRDQAGLAAQTPGVATASEIAAAKTAIAAFDKSCTAEDNNITLDGERDIAAECTRLWRGQSLENQKINPDNYLESYLKLLDPAVTPAEKASAYAAVVRLSPLVKKQAQGVIDLNISNMTPLEGKAKAMADNTTRLFILLAGAGVLLSVIFFAVTVNAILQPLATLTRSIKEVEAGNLDLVVQVKSRDELRQLAEAFNSMAARLREFRRTNRAKLLRTQQTTQLAINSLPDVVAVLAPDGHIEMANAAAERLFGLKADARVAEAGAAWLTELYQRVLTDLRPIAPRGYESTVQAFDEGGEEKFFLPHAVPILDEERQLLGVTVVLADVTNLRRLDEMKSGLLSVVSHELKTPLTSVRMGVHLMLEERVGSLTPQQSDLLTAMRDDSDRLHRIIENLLDMGRLESGKALIELKPVASEKLVNDAVEPMMAAYHDRGVELIADVPPETPSVMVDMAKINHVFHNLLTNSLKYTPAGGQVKIWADPRDGFVTFNIEDTGPGIPEAYLSRVFERFFRVPGQSSESGAGLGLAIAKDIVEAHGGKISVESRPGAGAKFVFSLQRQGRDELEPRAVRLGEEAVA
jgi:PAS domain S-box-containing protein